MPTIYDVARQAGVSTYTVSAVLNRSAYVSPELTERVKAAVKLLDYTPNEIARSLQTRKSRTIGMLIPDIANPFFAKVVRGAEDRLRKERYSLVLGSTYDDPAEQQRYLRLFLARQVDGVLLFIAPRGEDEVRGLVSNRKPLVMVGRKPKGFQADSVTADNRKGTKLAIEHLIGRGHRRIGLLVGQRSVSTAADRIAAWRRTLKNAGLEAPADYIGAGDWTHDSGRRLALGMLALPEPPTALYAANFLLLTGALAAVREARLQTPDNVEIVSSDDSEWLDVFEPAITTVVQPSYDMGEQAAELLVARIGDPKRSFESRVLEPTLHVRGQRMAAGA